MIPISSEGWTVVHSLFFAYNQSMHRRLISLTRSTPIPLVVTIAASFFAGILTIAQAWTLSLGHQQCVPEQLGIGSNVWSGMRLMLALIAGRALLAWLSDFSASDVAVRIKTDLRQRLFDHLLETGSNLCTR